MTSLTIHEDQKTTQFYSRRAGASPAMSRFVSLSVRPGNFIEACMTGIYGIRCIVNNKWYIGQSKDLHTRKRDHLSALAGSYHYNVHLQRAFNIYGSIMFECLTLEECSLDVLDERERYWINYYHSMDKYRGFNRESGGSQYKKASQETKLKISEWHKTNPKAKEQIQRLAEWHRGKCLSAETCRKVSLSLIGNKRRLGIPHSEESKHKMREAAKGRIYPVKTSEWKMKLSKANTGKHPSEETRRKLSLIVKERWTNGGYANRKRRCCDG